LKTSSIEGTIVLKEFKDIIPRGNALDPAAAVIIGGAFEKRTAE
jgi:large-conductance mechanosensitive channel